MEKLLELRYQDALKSLETLKVILEEPYSVIVRDATIQRFEYTFEAFWKFIREYLKEEEGIVCNSPKSCFKEMFSLGFLTEESCVDCLKMTDRRNDTSHTYKEEVAQIIYSETKSFFSLMKILLDKLKVK